MEVNKPPMEVTVNLMEAYMEPWASMEANVLPVEVFLILLPWKYKHSHGSVATSMEAKTFHMDLFFTSMEVNIASILFLWKYILLPWRK